MGRWGQEIVWTRQRVGLLFAVAVALGLVVAVLDGLLLDRVVFGHDVSGYVVGGLTGLAVTFMMRRWQVDERR